MLKFNRLKLTKPKDNIKMTSEKKIVGAAKFCFQFKWYYFVKEALNFNVSKNKSADTLT